jgi:putative tricarboxylic transport membrane protein
MTKPAWQDTCIGLAVLALAAIVAWQTTIIPENAIYARVGPKVFPWISTVLLAVMGAILTLQGLRGGWEHEEAGEVDTVSLGWLLLGLLLNLVLIDGMSFGGIPVAPKAGFIVAGTLLFICTARAFGSAQPLRDGAIGFVLALVAYVGFDRVLGYKIGSGWIEALL